MKIIKVEFKAESSVAIFCEINYTAKKKVGFFKKIEMEHTRTIQLDIYYSGVYSAIPEFSDTGEPLPLDIASTIQKQMILAHEEFKRNNTLISLK